MLPSERLPLSCEPSSPHGLPEEGQAVCCAVTAQAVVRVSREEVAGLRRQPGPVFQTPLPAAFLKHADEQTVVGLAAVLHAIQRYHLSTCSFRYWGALAAPRFLGRVATAAALHRFSREGAWGISPHLIPHSSLHAISGTVSQALKIYGPNFGVAGGPGGAGEALLAASALLQCRHLPGVWVVLTCMDPEPIPDETGQLDIKPDVVGLALALQPAQTAPPGIRMRLSMSAPAALPAEDLRSRWELNLFRLEGMLRLLRGEGSRPAAAVQWRERSLRIELFRDALALSRQVSSFPGSSEAGAGLKPLAEMGSLIARGVETGS